MRASSHRKYTRGVPPCRELACPLPKRRGQPLPYLFEEGLRRGCQADRSPAGATLTVLDRTAGRGLARVVNGACHSPSACALVGTVRRRRGRLSSAECEQIRNLVRLVIIARETVRIIAVPLDEILAGVVPT